MRTYLFDNDTSDCRLPHDSGAEVTPEKLSKLGVLYYSFPPSSPDSPSRVDELAHSRTYASRDEVTVSPQAMGEAYEEKIRMFFDEHMHEDEEIRYIQKGSGYFDVRDDQDQWVRIKADPGDLLILPAGIYHRFTVDENNYVNAIRLFKAAPKWTPLNRGPQTDANEYRQFYLEATGDASNSPDAGLGT
ncbi:MAG: 1,2-dihydroxy-3-keto-5-methylthiopentene dioxygenase [Alyxoria varia]|nr:MAG: 1,2-dihydroxy-3-keto-5-methylthiopentene dioxygenase [Alyxoria varia]